MHSLKYDVIDVARVYVAHGQLFYILRLWLIFLLQTIIMYTDNV